MGERSEIERVLAELLGDVPGGRQGSLGAPAPQWPGEELPVEPVEPVLPVFRPPPGVHLDLDLGG